jgi:hypothetical protein
MPALQDLKGFNLDAAQVTLWVFKGPTGPSDAAPSYSGHWVETTNDVDAALKQVVDDERSRLEETLEYGLLAQNNEASALSISTVETHAGLIVDATAAETEQRRTRDSRHLFNSKMYVIKLVSGGTVVHAVRKTDRGWATRRRRSVRSFVYDDNELAVDDRPHFEIERSIDFFVVGGDILILNKGHFESALRYKQAHQDDFQQLQGEAEFAGIFVDLQPLIDHVGANKIQLRRAAAIRQKGHYRDANFMARLRQRHAEFGLNLQFDNAGRIQVTPQTCVDVITALLDHRLASAFSSLVYDVPSSVEVHP